VSHKDIADNVFTSMDGGLSASSDDEEEKVDKRDDQQPAEEVERDAQNGSVAHSDELASNLSENVDEASIDDGNDGDAEADIDASIGTGDDNANSDVESATDDNNDDIASNISGKLSSECYAYSLHLCVSCFSINCIWLILFSRMNSRALQASIRLSPKDWRYMIGRPRQTWLRTVEDNLHGLDFGLCRLPCCARQHSGALGIDRLEDYSRRQLHLDMREREREREIIK